MRYVFVVLIAVGVLGDLRPVAAQNYCGIEPIKPIVPIGCDDLTARCVCDAQGRNCKWEWVCVKRRR